MTRLGLARIVACAVIMFLSASHLVALEEAQLLESRVAPESFTVGDRLAIDLLIKDDARVTAPVHAERNQLPQGEESSLYSMDMVRDERGLRIHLECAVFVADGAELPSLILGPLSVKLPTLEAKSVVEGGAALPNPPKDPLALPGSGLRIAFFVALILLGIGFVLFASTVGRRIVLALVEAYRSKLPYRSLLRAIASLESGCDAQSASLFYESLVASLKRYFSARFGLDCGPLTTSELVPALAGSIEAEELVFLRGLLDSGDLAKFGGIDVASTMRREQLAWLRVVAQRLATKEDGIDESR